MFHTLAVCLVVCNTLLLSYYVLIVCNIQYAYQQNPHLYRVWIFT